MTLEFHPLADLFPLLQGEPYVKLLGDIRENGQKDPITIFEGKVLDGRNRYRACIEAKIEPRFEPFKQDEKAALKLVISRNLHRRHLTDAQRVEIADKIARRGSGSYKQEDSKNRESRSLPVDEACEAMQVSRDQLDRHRAKQKRAPRAGKPLRPDITEGQRSAAVKAIFDEGMPRKEAEKKFGLTEKIVQLEVAKESGRREAAAESIAPEDLPKSHQEKLAAAIKHKTRELEAAFEQRVQALVNERIDELLPFYNDKLEHADAVIKARDGVMDRETFRLILGALHPDGAASKETKARAFQAFKELERVLLREKDLETASISTFPKTYEQMIATARRKSRQPI